MVKLDVVSCRGGGLITDQSIIAQTGISDPSPFFTQLLTKSYAGNVAMAPHIYGPSISHRGMYTGTDLFQSISTSVGYLNKQGYCVSPENCRVFPIIIGETGSALTDSRDFDFYISLIQYLNLAGDGDDGRHTAIDSVFWWSWNENSGSPLNYMVYHISNSGSKSLYRLLNMSSSKLTFEPLARLSFDHIGC